MTAASATSVGTTLLDELARQGVRDVVVSPGSRSGPLALAAAADPRLRLHVRIDERTAAFLALGIARGRDDRLPVVVICSSGTATANHAPAVREADLARVPLLLLTADRPEELRDTGANQTMDQVGLHGGALRWFADIGDVGAAELGDHLRRVAARAVATAAGGPSGPPGPVQVNVRLREPLFDADGAALAGRRPQPRWSPPPSTPTGQDQPLPEPVAELVALPRVLVVVGDAAPEPAQLLAAAADRGWPVIAEPTSGARLAHPALRAGHWLAATSDFVAAHPPDAVLVAGRPNLSRPTGALIAAAARVVLVDPHDTWWDPGVSAGQRVTAPVSGWVEGLRRRPKVTDERWAATWFDADRAAADVVADAVLRDDGRVTELGLVAELGRVLPPQSLLVCASSLPIRHLNETMPPRADVRVIGNRGVSGIDGFVSTAIGAGLGHEGPTVALTGDLSLLHDLTGFVTGPDEPLPSLPVVVLDNGGGGIFDLLPHLADVDHATFRRLFTTPQQIDLAALAAAARVAHVTLERCDELAAALRRAWQRPGITLLHAHTDAAEEARRYRRTLAAAQAAISPGRSASP